MSVGILPTSHCSYSENIITYFSCCSNFLCQQVKPRRSGQYLIINRYVSLRQKVRKVILISCGEVDCSLLRLELAALFRMQEQRVVCPQRSSGLWTSLFLLTGAARSSPPSSCFHVLTPGIQISPSSLCVVCVAVIYSEFMLYCSNC